MQSRLTATIFIFGLLVHALSCRSSFSATDTSGTSAAKKKQRPLALEHGKFFESDGRQLLFGGEADRQHFDITNLELAYDQFHYGIGREKFPALLEPAFYSVTEADSVWPDSARFLVAYSGSEVKAYAVDDLTRHEVVNDVLDGQPIMAVYCILADLGAVYRRDYGDKELTFALSGYTYFDPQIWDGLDGFVLWDRETESLWWPLIDKAVSGPLKDVKLRKLDQPKWKDTHWVEIKNEFPTARVLRSGQDYERPKDWRKLDDISSIIENFRR